MNPDIDSLAKRSKAGDASAERELIEIMMPQVKKIASMTPCSGEEAEDLVQEGLIGLIEAVRDYNQDISDSFFPFAVLCIKRQIQNARQKNSRQKNRPLNNYVPFDTDGNEEPSDILATDASDPERVFFDDCRVRDLLNDIDNKLSPFERRVLFLHISGRKNNDVARILDCSIRSVENALHRIRQKLR
jgi:RNA polymerase sporulation-specific sigma factor